MKATQMDMFSSFLSLTTREQQINHNTIHIDI